MYATKIISLRKEKLINLTIRFNQSFIGASVPQVKGRATLSNGVMCYHLSCAGVAIAFFW